MKFEKSVYKSAMDKIDNPEKRRDKESQINQKYKSDVLSGRINDRLAGWDNDSAYYDAEMLKHEYNRKMVWCLLFITLGIVVIAVVCPNLSEALELKFTGTKQRAYYGWSVDFHDYGYIYEWTYVDGKEVSVDNIGQEGGITIEESERLDEIEASKNIKMFSSTELNKDVFLVCKWDEKGTEIIRNCKGMSEKEAMATAIKQGVEPVDNYIYVELSVPVWGDGKKGEYIDLYYMPQNGETYLDSRIVSNWVLDFALLLIIVLFIVFWIGRLIKLGMEERAIK